MDEGDEYSLILRYLKHERTYSFGKGVAPQ